MRLTEDQKRIIQEEVRAVFGPYALVRLFGSRLNDAMKGGDIDLHVEAEGSPRELLDRELRLQARLQRRLGDRRIDIIVQAAGAPAREIDEHARRTGTTL